MTAALRLCMLGVCGALALGASAAESPAYNDASVAPAKAAQASGGAARGRDTRIEKGGPMVQESTHAVSGNVGGVKARTAAVADTARRDSLSPPTRPVHGRAAILIDCARCQA